jgi:Ni/Fe-hydrogenase subunit HybB-like protein
MIEPHDIPQTMRRLLWIGVFAGLTAALAAAFGFASDRFWISFLINVCFWTGLAQGGVIFSAAYRMTNGQWGETLRRVGEGFVLFLPIGVLLFLLTFFGRTTLWPWIEDPIPAKASWLNEPFFFLRIFVYTSVMAAMSFLYVRLSVRPDLAPLQKEGRLPPSRLLDFLTKGWRREEESDDPDRKLRMMVPGILIAFGGIYSFVGFDVVMSLDPHWYSTMYGWLYFVHAFDAGVAGTIITAILARKYFKLHDNVSTKQFYDVSRLLMGLCMLAGGFYWSQFLVIWYGNLGEEIERLILRFDHAPWPPFQWTVILLLYLFPIVIFLSKSIKERPRALLIIASVILGANWLYQFVEIAPSTWHHEGVPLGIMEVLVTIGFMSAVGLSWLAYARVVPLISVEHPDPTNT